MIIAKVLDEYSRHNELYGEYPNTLIVRPEGFHELCEYFGIETLRDLMKNPRPEFMGMKIEIHKTLIIEFYLRGPGEEVITKPNFKDWKHFVGCDFGFPNYGSYFSPITGDMV